MKKIIISLTFLFLLDYSKAAIVNTYNRHTIANWTVYVDSDLAKSDSTVEKKGLLKLKKSLLLIEEKLPKFFLNYARSDSLKIFITSSRKVENRTGMFFIPQNHNRWNHNFERIMNKSVVITNKSLFLLNSSDFSYYLIHELAHYYHFNVLGYSNQFILRKYYTASKDFNYRGAYALGSHLEFFAELSAMFFVKRETLTNLDKDGVDLMKYLWGHEVYKSSVAILTEGLSNMPDWEALRKNEKNRVEWAFGIPNEKED